MIKKITAATTALVAASAFSVNASSGISVVLDGSELSFDVSPQIVDGRTLVPLRVIFEALGAEVEWDGEAQTVTAKKDDTRISMTIGNNVITVNSEEIALDVPPQIINDRTLVPVRAVAEGFGANVDWQSETSTVVINTPTAVPTAQPVITPTETPLIQQEFPIEYNDALERTVDYVNNFKLTSVSKNANGDYDIEFTLYTYLEGRGIVSVSFRCLDENGKVVDTFSGSYMGTDYTQSRQQDKATISGKTAVIELITEDNK